MSICVYIYLYIHIYLGVSSVQVSLFFKNLYGVFCHETGPWKEHDLHVQLAEGNIVSAERLQSPLVGTLFCVSCVRLHPSR